MSEQVIYRKSDLPRVTGLSSRTVERLEARGEFPPRLKLSTRAVGWRSADVQAWMRERIGSCPAGALGQR